MKRLTIIAALVLMITMPTMAERVAPETAHKVAYTFLKNNGAKTSQLNDLSKVAGFPNLYIFTTDESFVVLAADDCVKPILGYSLTGSFVAEDMPESVHCWLQGYSDQIQYAIEHQAKSSFETERQWKELAEGRAEAAKTTTVVAALTQTQWDQGDPYNMLCPSIGSTKTTAGCVATAMAQIMKYWNYPVRGTGSHSYTWRGQNLIANFGDKDYDWNNMTNEYNSSSTTIQKTAVATLMYHCGVSINMEYNIPDYGYSNAVTSDVMSALQTYFGYAPNMQYKLKDEYSDSLWIEMLKTELDEGRPLQYRGDAGGNFGGHSFVCDGYDSDNNFHFNWGWSGFPDSFFSVNNLAPGNGGVYTTGESAIFGIEPVKSLSVPTLSASIHQNTITLSWNTVEGATSYDVYKDNCKIGNGITDTTFVDSDTEFGTYYEYYVKAVFSSNERSNSSNRVTKCPLYRDIKPSNLTANLEDDNITLTWDGYSGGLSTDLHYGNVMSFRECGISGSYDAYWGQRYPASMLSQLKGMSITKISTCIYYKGTYTLYLYSGNLDGGPREIIAELPPYTKKNASIKWKDFVFDSPIEIDCSKDLWVVFFSHSSDPRYPEHVLYSLEYNGDNANDAKYISSTLDGLFSIESVYDKPVSWLIRTYISDGTYSYNLYDGDTKVNGDEPISGTSYTVNNIPNNAALQYTVKTNCYGGESEASNMVGYIVGNAELGSLILDVNDKMTLTEGSMLTVNNMLISPNKDNLILEDGVQLFTSSKNVHATVKKSIMGRKTDFNGGWNFIATPVTDKISPDESNAMTGDYDLYRFNQYAEGKEWQNFKAHADYTLVNSQGYLYANTDNVNLAFAGPLYNGDGKFDLAFYNNRRFAGWNLVGNPFPCNATIDRSYYVIKDKKLVVYSGTDPIPPCTGVMVHVDKKGQVVRFKRVNPTAPFTPGFQPNQLQITVAQNVTDRNRVSTSVVEDNAIISFNEGKQLEKFVFDAEASKLYIPRQGRDYAIAVCESQGEIPVSFRAAENGSYTLTVKPEGVEMNYLHLIDNMTGDNIDLLLTPSYTFNARTTDYESRFIIVFASGSVFEDEHGDDDFAFYSNGQWIINNNCDATVQVIDMTGRILSSEPISGGCGIQINSAHGIHILRLISGDKIKTQKILVY